MGTGKLFPPGVKWSGHDTDYLPLSSAEIKDDWSYTSTPLICVRIVYRDKFTFYLGPTLSSSFPSFIIKKELNAEHCSGWLPIGHQA
jgi:hypothetical protein